MNILVYGAGAVGLGLSSCLLKSKQKIDIIAREQTVSSLKESGLKRNGIFGDFFAPSDSFCCYASLQELPESSYDFILVTVKSFDSRNAAENISRYPVFFHKKTKIILCQNGWGNTEIFTLFFPKEKIYNARIITGFTRPNPNEVTVTVHADAIKMGSLFSSDLKVLNDVCEHIAKGDIPCKVSQEIEKDLWDKMLYNCALNSLSAILDASYGTLGGNEHSRQLMNSIIEEAFSIMQKSGYKTHWDSAKDYLEVFYTKFIPLTYEHRSSTLQDIKAKKKTEIAALNGAVIELAERISIDVPINSAVYKMVKFTEEINATTI